MSELVNKVTLSTKKVVLLREFKIKHQEMAIKAVGKRGQGNDLLTNLYVAQELVKILIVKIDDQEVTPVKLEDLDAVFTPQEFKQLTKVVEMLMGGDEADAVPNLEHVTYGAK